MRAAEFLDALAKHESDLRLIDTMTAGERDELRGEALRRLASGELFPPVAVAVLLKVGIQPAVPDLVRLLRNGTTTPVVRSAALALLRHDTEETEADLVGEAIAIEAAAEIIAQKGTPFERLAFAYPEDDDVDIDEIVDELLESFYASPEAATDADAGELRFWSGELVHLGVVYGFGSPASWGPATIDEILSDLMPRKVTIESAAEAESAVAVFRTFFRWASRVAPVPHAEAIDAALQKLESEFPAMMMDESRFGPAKSFITQGIAAGFDMSTEEGLRAFQKHWNREHPIPRVDSFDRKKLEAAKKRKAKMAKLSRRKNRRKK